jgi:cell division septum initiation protein DivIVA
MAEDSARRRSKRAPILILGFSLMSCQHVDLRATFLLFYRYMDFQAKNKALEQDIARMKDEVKAAETTCEDLRVQAQTEREAAEAKYARLVHTSREERLRATAMEKSKRDHAEKMEREWRE